MSIKMNDLTRKQVERIVLENQMYSPITNQNPYIASGPQYEIPVSQISGGLYEVEMLDKIQIEETLQQTIKVFEEYVNALKS